MSDRAPAGFLDGVFDRTLANLRSAWREIAGSARGVLTGAPRPDLPDDDAAPAAPADAELPRRPRRRGHRPGPRRRSRPHLPGARTRPGASAFCGCWPRSSTSTTTRSTSAAPRWPRPPSRPSATAAERALRAALTPPRVTLLRQFNALPEGVKFLVDRRAELIELGRRRSGAARAGRRSARAARQLVRHRLSRTEADHLGVAGGAARKADGLRGGARDPRLDRPEEPARGRPPLLRLLSSAHAGRAADLCRGRAGLAASPAISTRCSTRRRRSATRRPPIPRSSIRSRTASAGSSGSALATS